jgi:hypothetical protein
MAASRAVASRPTPDLDAPAGQLTDDALDALASLLVDLAAAEMETSPRRSTGGEQRKRKPPSKSRRRIKVSSGTD